MVDVVEIDSLKRSEGERKFKVNAFGNEIDLDLLRTDGLLPDNLPVHVYGEDENGDVTVDDWTHSVSSQPSNYLYAYVSSQLSNHIYVYVSSQPSNCMYIYVFSQPSSRMYIYVFISKHPS